jgi:hypothetical protein
LTVLGLRTETFAVSFIVLAEGFQLIPLLEVWYSKCLSKIREAPAHPDVKVAIPFLFAMSKVGFV